MLRNILIAAILAVAAIATRADSLMHENVNGCYIVPKGDKHYVVVNHVLYANADGQWYALRAPQIDCGFVRGMPLVQKEQWVKVGGSHVITYSRTPSSFRNLDRAPAMNQN